MITVCARRSFCGCVFGRGFNSPRLHHKTTVILIELRWSFFDKKLWLTVIDTVTVHADVRVPFNFQGGREIDV